MSDRRERITSFEQMGLELGHKAHPRSRSESEIFYASSLLGRLRLLYVSAAKAIDKDTKQDRLAITAADVLRMPKKQRMKEKITVVVTADLDEDGKIRVLEDEKVPERVTIAFPLKKRSDKQRDETDGDNVTAHEIGDTSVIKHPAEPRFVVLRTTVEALSEHAGMEREELTQLADEVRQELPHELHGRMLIDIKTLDAHIRAQKRVEEIKTRTHPANYMSRPVPGTTDEMERLNNAKTLQLLRFFQLSQQLEARYGLRPLFEVKPADDYHATVLMWFVDEPLVATRVRDRRVPVVLVDGDRYSTTNTNIERMRRYHEQYKAHPIGNPDYVVAGHQTWELLEDPAVWERKHVVA